MNGRSAAHAASLCAILAAASCTAPPGPSPPGPSFVSPRPSPPPLPPPPPLTTELDAGTPPPDAPTVSMDAWEKGCTAWLEAAIRTATAVEPGLRGAYVEHERRPDKQRVWIAAFPPVFPIGGLHVNVERMPGRAAESAGLPQWQRHAESFHGGYHATHMRRAGENEAWVSFDGWDPEQVRKVAPYFEAAAEHCDGAAALP